jgi:predicted nucleotidyltransferase
MVTKRDYTAEKVDAARSVLIELVHLLGEYRDDIVLIGGWVPEILITDKKNPHVGSMDIDLALNHRTLTEEGYNTIEQLLLNRGYSKGSQPFIYYRLIKTGDTEIKVQVDLLAGEYEGTGKSHRHQKIQGIQARKVRGCDLAFEMTQNVTVEGELPEGGKDSVSVRVASIVPFFIMKGIALDDRLKEKDARDVYYCLKYYPGGLDALVEEFTPHVQHGLVREGLEKIAKHFASEKHDGPKFVADFEGETDPESRELLQRDAFERINYILGKIGII